MARKNGSAGVAEAVEYETLGYVGRRALRDDAREKVTGSALFLDDMKLAGMLYGKALRSRYPHARIVRIDTSAAEKLPGVRGIVTGAELSFLHGESLCDEPLLARDRVRYLGEAVAAVAATDEETADRALQLIEVEYEELPAVFDVLEAAKPGAQLLHESVEKYKRATGITPIPGTNVCNHFQLTRGDVDKGFAEADFVFEDTFTTPMQQHCCVEPHMSICRISRDNRLTLWCNNDSPFRARQEIAGALKLPMADIRLITPQGIGGNFGGKGGLKSEAVAIALAWKVRGRPIRVLYTREEVFCSTIGRHPSVIRMKTGVKRDGTIVARKVEYYLETGAYAEKGPTVTRFCGVSVAGPYKIPNVRVDGYCVYTNKPLAGAFRGYGGLQAAWAYESQMDIIARKLNLDPLEIRLRQVYEEGDQHITGQELFSHGLKECLERVAKEMDWKRPRGRDRGLGLAGFERAVKTPFGSAAFVRLNEDGSADILSSSTEVGQGSETILRQIVADEMGVPLDIVRKHTPDTAFTPFDASTTSSRSTFHSGNAVKMAAADVKRQVLDLAAPVLKAEVADLRVRDGKVFVAADPQRSATIADVLRHHFGTCGTVLGRGYYFPEMPLPSAEYYSRYMVHWLLGAAGAEVEVNRKTGQVKVIKIWSASDLGKVLNPLNCEGQVEGGVLTGLGYALTEGIVYQDGVTLNPGWLGYKMPTAWESPEIVSIFVENAHPGGPFGAKGFGETTNVPVPPAIANAIYDAVGVRIRDLPITPDKVLAALQEKERQEKAGGNGRGRRQS